jgi:PadR family transcriptional regulator, regulatory protein PadR
MQHLDEYERKLLEGWEEIYKKGQLTLWIMLALKDGPKHMSEIKEFIARTTNGTLTADDKSMYRALRRYYDAELVDFKQVPGKNGPDLKIYSLSPAGEKVLNQFAQRNLINVFFKPEIKSLLERIKS